MSSEITRSNTKNQPHKFTQNLVSRLNFEHGLWRVALTSILIPSDILMFESLELQFTIYTLQFDPPNELTVSPDIEPVTHIPPRTLSSCKEVIEYFKEKVKDFIDVDIQRSGLIVLRFNKAAKIVIGKHLARILGHSLDKSITITGAQNQSWVFTNHPNEIEIFPTSISLLCNFVENSIVGEKLMKLLKLIPLSNKKDDDYLSIEFETNEFVNLRTTELKELEFELYTNNDEFIGFKSGVETPIYFNLLFQQF